jgi:peptide-methionine (S)-S-oxide reductase
MKKTALLLTAFLISVLAFAQEPRVNKDTQILPEVPKLEKNQSFAVLASGCFWCVELIFEDLPGVVDVVSGYSGGRIKNPTYREIGTEKTGHAEAILVVYDTTKITFTDLLEIFFASHDPTTLNAQGPEKGEMYRSIAFYNNDKEKKIIENAIVKLTRDQVFENPIVTEVQPFEAFYPAEKYHQDYAKQNPNEEYVKTVSVPRCEAFKANYKGKIELNRE